MQDQTRDVTISTTEAVALPLADALRDYRAVRGVSVELRVSNGFLDLVRGDADVAAHLMQAPWANLSGRRIADVNFAVYAARRYLDGTPFERDAADWVCMDRSRADWPQARWEAEVVPLTRVALRAGSLQIALDSILLGDVIGVLPCGVAARHPDLVPVSAVIADLTLPLWLITPRDLARTDRIRDLIRFVDEELQRERPLIEGAGLPAAGFSIASRRRASGR